MHVAIIPDGNRRWAKKGRRPPLSGHFEGANVFQKILKTALNLEIEHLTIWGGSFDNLTKRKKVEIKTLFNIYDKYFKELLDNKEIYKEKVRIRILGRFKELLPPKTLRVIEEVQEKTKDFDNHCLAVLIGYNGQDEMLDVVKKIVSSAQKNKVLRITPELIKKNLWTKDLPPVDLVVRTGVEDDPHNSAGFMMWDTAYSQYYFTKTLWPDFSPREFKKAVKSFSKRERRLGI